MKKEALDWMGELAIIHTTGKDTDGKYCVVELYATAEGNPPWHVHRREDEGFYVIDGEFTIYVGNETHHAKSGDYILAPRDIPHRYTVDSEGHARLLMICSPAGFEDCVRAMSTPASSMVPPAPDTADIDFEQVADIAAIYGIEFLEDPNQK